MSDKSKMLLVGLAAGGVVGFLSGTSSAEKHIMSELPEPEVKVVEVPKVVTKTETETEFVTLPLPESCESIPDYARFAVSRMERYASASQLIAQTVDNELVPAAQLEDIPALSDANVKVQELSDKTTTLLYLFFNAQEGIELKMSQCSADLKGAKEGDIYEAADGKPMTNSEIRLLLE